MDNMLNSPYSKQFENMKIIILLKIWSLYFLSMYNVIQPENHVLSIETEIILSLFY